MMLDFFSYWKEACFLAVENNMKHESLCWSALYFPLTVHLRGKCSQLGNASRSIVNYSAFVIYLHLSKYSSRHLTFLCALLQRNKTQGEKKGRKDL